MRHWLVPLSLLLGSAVACGGSLTLPGSHGPAQLTIVAGDGQRASAGAALPEPLIVAVEDAEGFPVAGTQVQFGFPDDPPDAAVDPDTARTDSAGHAAVRVRLGTSTGPQFVQALVPTPGEDLRVQFQATALTPPGGRGSGGGQSGGGGSSGGGSGGGQQGGGGSSGGQDAGSGGGGGGGHHSGHDSGNHQGQGG